MSKLSFLLAVLCSVSFWACRNEGSAATASANSSDIAAIDALGGENFAEFYDKFLTDSLFQVSRVVFPVAGRPKFVDSLTHKDEFYYTADAWEMHKKIDLSDTKKFNRKFTDMGIGLVKEIIEMNQGKDVLFIERRYRLDDKKWYLIFFGNLNVRNPEAMNER